MDNQRRDGRIDIEEFMGYFHRHCQALGEDSTAAIVKAMEAKMSPRSRHG